GKTTVPMSRPSTTTPAGCRATARRCSAFTHARTSGNAATADTRAVTRSDRTASSTSTPATVGVNSRPTSASAIGRSRASPTIRWTFHPSPFPRPSSPRLSSAANVSARYNAPESRCAQPSRSATRAPVDDFPDAAGPSIAMTRTLPPSPSPHAPQILEEPRITDRDRRPLRQPHVRARHRPQHGERHRQAVVAGRVHAAARWAGGPPHPQVVAAGFRVAAHRLEVRRDQLEAIALLDPQLAHLAEHRLSPRPGPAREHRQHRHLVDEG